MRGKWNFIPASVVAVLVVASLIAQLSGIERKILGVFFKSSETGPARVEEGADYISISGSFMVRGEFR